MSAPRGGWRVRLLVLGSFAAVFAAGAAAGVAWERTRGARPELRVMVHGGRAQVDAFGDVGLTPEQRRRIEQIFVRAQPRTDRVLHETLPRLRAVTDSINLEIEAVLTPEQRRHLGPRQRRVFDMHHKSGH